jgi:hypothetical protein
MSADHGGDRRESAFIGGSLSCGCLRDLRASVVCQFIDRRNMAGRASFKKR